MHEVITSRTGTKHFAIFLFLNDLFHFRSDRLVFSYNFLSLVLSSTSTVAPLHLISIRAWRSALVRPAPLPHSPPSLASTSFPHSSVSTISRGPVLSLHCPSPRPSVATRSLGLPSGATKRCGSHLNHTPLAFPPPHCLAPNTRCLKQLLSHSTEQRKARLS